MKTHSAGVTNALAKARASKKCGMNITQKKNNFECKKVMWFLPMKMLMPHTIFKLVDLRTGVNSTKLAHIAIQSSKYFPGVYVMILATSSDWQPLH